MIIIHPLPQAYSKIQVKLHELRDFQDKVLKMLANFTLFKLKLDIISTWKVHANVDSSAYFRLLSVRVCFCQN